MADAKKTYVTEQGLKDLQDEYNTLVHVTREEVKAELKEARSLGDLSENRIAELEEMLKNYEIISTKGNSKTVRIGSTVQLQFQDTKEEAVYSIVGRTEADPLNGKISNETALAQAILDKRVGQTVEVNCKKPYEVTIISVK